MSGAEYGPLAHGQRGVQVLASANLDEFPEGPGPAPQPHHVDSFTGLHSEELPSQALSPFRPEFVTEHPAQVEHDVGTLLDPIPEAPVSSPAGDAIGEAGRQARNQRRYDQQVDNSLGATQEAFRGNRAQPATPP